MIIAWGLFIFSTIYVCFILTIFALAFIKDKDIGKSNKQYFERHMWFYSIVALCSAQYIWG